MNIRGSLPRGKVVRAWSWNTHAHVVLRSRMTGDIPLLYLYGFMARTGTTFSLPSIVPAGPTNKNSLYYTPAVLCKHITLSHYGASLGAASTMFSIFTYNDQVSSQCTEETTWHKGFISKCVSKLYKAQCYLQNTSTNKNVF